MQCMICKHNVSEDEIICPNCGAMPWRMPERFLNSEQHYVWLKTIYIPQHERWKQLSQLRQQIVDLQQELQVSNLKVKQLQEDNKRLQIRIEQQSISQSQNYSKKKKSRGNTTNLSQFASDLNLTSQEVINQLKVFDAKERTPASMLSANEMNYLLEYFTQQHQVETFDDFFSNRN